MLIARIYFYSALSLSPISLSPTHTNTLMHSAHTQAQLLNAAAQRRRRRQRRHPQNNKKNSLCSFPPVASSPPPPPPLQDFAAHELKTN